MFIIRWSQLFIIFTFTVINEYELISLELSLNIKILIKIDKASVE